MASPARYSRPGVLPASWGVYCGSIFPLLRRELGRWSALARAIPDPLLRQVALEAAQKRGNMEGAALLGVLAPRSARAWSVRAVVALQSAYNYLDTLAERPSEDPRERGRRLHEALAAAVDPAGPIGDYYPAGARHSDGGYLLEMVSVARRELSALPSFGVVQPAVAAAAARIVAFQSLNHGDDGGDIHPGLELWVRECAPPAAGLNWWETAAAAGSSLGMYALIGLAGHSHLTPQEVSAVERAYFPSIGALHSLLDSVVDVDEDRRDGQRSLLSYYSSSSRAALRMGELAREARQLARGLPRGPLHDAILRAMCAHYLSAGQARTCEARLVAGEIQRQSGLPGNAVLVTFRSARALIENLSHRG